MSGLQSAQLGEVCTINPRLQPHEKPSPDAPVTFVPMAAIDETEGRIALPQERPFREVAKGYTAFRSGDVLFAKITPCMENGKAAIALNLKNNLGFGSTEFHVLRPSEIVVAEYIFYFIRRPEFRRLAKANFTGTAGQQRVPTNFLERTLIPLPSLAEQRRMVDMLNRVGGIRRLHREAMERSDHLLATLMARFFEG